MKSVAVIPARYASTRFPGKPLASIAGKSMIERVFRQVQKADCFLDIIVATDDMRIASCVKDFGGKAVMTGNEIATGTERVWWALGGTDFDAILNIQGDEPLISPQLIRDLHDLLKNDNSSVVSAIHWNLSYDDFISPHVVKVVKNRFDQAIYFSRCSVPYTPQEQFRGFFHHIGIYGYKRSALALFIKTPMTPLEKCERLEQLRFLECGQNIQLAVTEYISRGVDVPEDIAKIELALREGQDE